MANDLCPGDKSVHELYLKVREVHEERDKEERAKKQKIDKEEKPQKKDVELDSDEEESASNADKLRSGLKFTEGKNSAPKIGKPKPKVEEVVIEEEEMNTKPTPPPKPQGFPGMGNMPRPSMGGPPNLDNMTDDKMNSMSEMLRTNPELVQNMM